MAVTTMSEVFATKGCSRKTYKFIVSCLSLGSTGFVEGIPLMISKYLFLINATLSILGK